VKQSGMRADGLIQSDRNPLYARARPPFAIGASLLRTSGRCTRLQRATGAAWSQPRQAGASTHRILPPAPCLMRGEEKGRCQECSPRHRGTYRGAPSRSRGDRGVCNRAFGGSLESRSPAGLRQHGFGRLRLRRE
jgi:hypothetical protein